MKEEFKPLSFSKYAIHLRTKAEKHLTKNQHRKETQNQKCSLQLNKKEKYPKTLKEQSLDVLGYFYAQN